MKKRLGLFLVINFQQIDIFIFYNNLIKINTWQPWNLKRNDVGNIKGIKREPAVALAEGTSFGTAL